MARMGSFDINGLEKLQKELEKLDNNTDEFIQSCANELAERLLRKVVKRTPVGEYDKPVSFTTRDGKQVNFTPHTGKVGGILRDGWTIGVMRKEGNDYIVEVTNPIWYASYVESGHCTANRKKWVKGQFMMAISEEEIRKSAPQMLRRKIEKFLRRAFNG